ncbi:hypothetical protein FQN51_009348 [Onygenales sp. PD_10]|nr:hypothetical protein FQN51_009348 [Onygenales sp. PD_10]
MSALPLTDDWLKCLKVNHSGEDNLAWTASISRTRVSTVDGLSLNEHVTAATISGLEILLRAVQQLKLKRVPAEKLEDHKFLAAGETFAVFECTLDGAKIALKRIKLEQPREGEENRSFQRRLQSVHREVLAMCHPPLASHPNIVDFLGYGWSLERQQLSPFICVELAYKGSLRTFMSDSSTSIKTKLTLSGDVAAGLVALHRCGVVHGDMKLDNVVVVPALDRPCMVTAKISDFGHSIFTASVPDEGSYYYGTVRYNAPEVAAQHDEPIPPDQLHKCDIWAFGLCVWEILADGQVYSQSNQLDVSVDNKSPSPVGQQDNLGSGDQVALRMEGHNGEAFSHSKYHFKELAKQFVNSLDISGHGLEKNMLRGLFERTLQNDPGERMSDLSRLPILATPSKTSRNGNTSLQTKLTMYTLAGDIQQSIFAGRGGLHIPWRDQEQLLNNFKTTASQSLFQSSTAAANFQVSLCYINAFGTSRNFTRATEFLCRAKQGGHLIAQLLGPRLIDAFAQNSKSEKTYTQLLTHGFRSADDISMFSNIVVRTDGANKSYSNYNAFRESFLRDFTKILDEQRFPGITFGLGKSPTRLNLLEISIQNDDSDLVKSLLPVLSAQELGKQDSRGLAPLAQAARRGNASIVKNLLQAGAPLFQENGVSLLHWLFCLEDQNVSEIIQFVSGDIGTKYDHSLLNTATHPSVSLHPQWSFRVHGTPLACAIASGSIFVVKTLLELGAAPLALAFPSDEMESKLPWTPMHLAVGYNFPEMVEMLWETALSAGSNPALPAAGNPSSRRFPIACGISCLSSAERLAIHGVNYTNNLRETIYYIPRRLLFQSTLAGKSAITEAIDLEDVDAVGLLLDYCPDLASIRLGTPESPESHTFPLHFAVQIGSNRETHEALRIVKTILEFDLAAINKPDSSSLIPLHIAAMGLSTSITQYLIDMGASVHAVDSRGRTPLHHCRFPCNARTLLEHGADINQQDKEGFTAANSAVIRGGESVLQELIQSGANLNLGCNTEKTPLHYAIITESRPITDLLLKANAGVDVQDASHHTPLRLAIDKGHTDLAILLLEHGANPCIEDLNGWSPFCMALTSKNSLLLSKFLKHDAVKILPPEKILSILHYGAVKGEPGPLNEYMRWAPSTVEFDCEKSLKNSLHIAAEACRPDIVGAILARGFDIHRRDSKGNTPLLLACQGGRSQELVFSDQRIQTCSILLSAGADIIATNLAGMNPIVIAQIHCDYPLMTFLIRHVLPPNTFDIPARYTDMFNSALDPKEDQRLSNNARALIGGACFGPSILQDAVNRGEWDFLITCIAGHLICLSGLEGILHTAGGALGGARLFMLQLCLYCIRRDRDMVRYIFRGPGSEKPYFGPTHLSDASSDYTYRLAHVLFKAMIDRGYLKPDKTDLKLVREMKSKTEQDARRMLDALARAEYVQYPYAVKFSTRPSPPKDLLGAVMLLRMGSIENPRRAYLEMMLGSIGIHDAWYALHESWEESDLNFLLRA